MHAAIARLLEGHDPYPAVVVDRHWNVVQANAGVGLLTEGLPSHLLAPPKNSLRVSLHPDGLAPRICNLRELRAHVLRRLRHQVAVTADPAPFALERELKALSPATNEREAEPEPEAEIFIPFRYRYGDRELVFLSTVTTFGTALDITVAELTLESFFPADAQTRAFFAERTGQQANA